MTARPMRTMSAVGVRVQPIASAAPPGGTRWTRLGQRDGVYGGRSGGEQSGPSPVYRRKPGTKHTLLVSRRSVPLAIRTAGANANDHTQIIPRVTAGPRVGGEPRRRRTPERPVPTGSTTANSTRWPLAFPRIDPRSQS